MTSPKNIAERETPPTPATPERTFPIQGPTPHRRIPWWLAEEAYASYSRHGTTQSLEMLAARGGFGAEEMDMFAPGWSDRLDHVKQLQAELTRLRAGGEPTYRREELTFTEQTTQLRRITMWNKTYSGTAENVLAGLDSATQRLAEEDNIDCELPIIREVHQQQVVNAVEDAKAYIAATPAENYSITIGGHVVIDVSTNTVKLNKWYMHPSSY